MIPLVKPIFGAEEKKLVNEVIDSGIIASGSYVSEFEKKCANYNKTQYAIATSNGTTALHTALLACGIKKGDKILTTPFSFIATSNSILYCGAEPVFADIDPETYNLSKDSAEEAFKKHKDIKAILLVHLYGLPCEMDSFLKLKEKYNFILIEDCAQAHGAEYNGKKVGSFGDSSAFSYYATKNITTGEGGIVLTNNSEIDKLSRQIINHGRSEHSVHSVLGYNYRMTNIAAAIGLVQMSHLNDWNKKRKQNAAILSEGLKDTSFLKIPYISNKCDPVFHQYTIRVNSKIRQKLMDYLTKNEVGCGIYYPRVIYSQPLYENLGFQKGLCPKAEKAADEVLSIPVHPSLTRKQLEKIISIIKNFNGKN
ncbi:MAG: DegT/DnrJ/EryC1/StrS family aminotransferase [Elusimicrobia bacterium]|nr:DegT/DnrJ/EryC1/StrS family aminotransferase [Elusimicrobiota bacterium]